MVAGLCCDTAVLGDGLLNILSEGHCSCSRKRFNQSINQPFVVVVAVVIAIVIFIISIIIGTKFGSSVRAFSIGGSNHAKAPRSTCARDLEGAGGDASMSLSTPTNLYDTAQVVAVIEKAPRSLCARDLSGDACDANGHADQPLCGGCDLHTTIHPEVRLVMAVDVQPLWPSALDAESACAPRAYGGECCVSAEGYRQ